MNVTARNDVSEEASDLLLCHYNGDSRFTQNVYGATFLLVCTASHLSTMMTSVIARGYLSLNVGVMFAVTLNTPREMGTELASLHEVQFVPA